MPAQLLGGADLLGGRVPCAEKTLGLGIHHGHAVHRAEYHRLPIGGDFVQFPTGRVLAPDAVLLLVS